jgi:hypothetical protein
MAQQVLAIQGKNCIAGIFRSFLYRSITEKVGEVEVEKLTTGSSLIYRRR